MEINRYFAQNSRVGFHLLKFLPWISQEYTHSHIHMNPVYSGFKDTEQLKAKLPKPIFSFV